MPRLTLSLTLIGSILVWATSASSAQEIAEADRARADAAGGYRVSGFSTDGLTHFDLALPGRGHSFALRPRGHQAVHFARRPGRYLSSAKVSDGCGVAPGAGPGEFLASSGLGGMVVIDARSGTARPLAVGGLEAARWDNHLIAAPLIRRTKA